MTARYYFKAGGAKIERLKLDGLRSRRRSFAPVESIEFDAYLELSNDGRTVGRVPLTKQEAERLAEDEEGTATFYETRNAAYQAQRFASLSGNP